MNSKEHVLRLSALERELRAMSDGEMHERIEALPDESKTWITSLGRGPDPEEGIDIAALRGAISRGRLKGVPDRVAGVLTSDCLRDCVDTLGDRADLLSEEDLREALPGLVARHGLSTTRVMFAAAVLGDAPASPAIRKVLKSGLPAAQAAPLT